MRAHGRGASVMALGLVGTAQCDSSSTVWAFISNPSHVPAALGQLSKLLFWNVFQQSVASTAPKNAPLAGCYLVRGLGDRV